MAVTGAKKGWVCPSTVRASVHARTTPTAIWSRKTSRSRSRRRPRSVAARACSAVVRARPAGGHGPPRRHDEVGVLAGPVGREERVLLGGPALPVRPVRLAVAGQPPAHPLLRGRLDPHPHRGVVPGRPDARGAALDDEQRSGRHLAGLAPAVGVPVPHPVPARPRRGRAGRAPGRRGGAPPRRARPTPGRPRPCARRGSRGPGRRRGRGSSCPSRSDRRRRRRRCRRSAARPARPARGRRRRRPGRPGPSPGTTQRRL